MGNTLTFSISEAKLSPGLYLVPTPLGNLADMTVRALEVLMRCDVIYCEDTRISQKLLRHYGIAKALRRYDDHSDETLREAIINDLDDNAIALISDAGTPLINDPGFKLARDALAQGKALTALPGPCAPILALSLSGLASDRFTYYGYLPNKQKARQDACARMAKIAHTQIVFESVHRIAASLADMASAMGDRPAALCREMTKTYEEIDRDSLDTLATRWANKPAKGEFVIVIGPQSAQTGEVDIDAALKAAFAQGMSVKEAAAAVAKDSGMPKRQVYQAALALKDSAADG